MVAVAVFLIQPSIASAFLSAAMCAGVVWQHPPTSRPSHAPRPCTSRTIPATSSCHGLRLGGVPSSSTSASASASSDSHVWLDVS